MHLIPLLVLISALNTSFILLPLMSLNQKKRELKLWVKAKLLLAAMNGEKGLTDMKANCASWFLNVTNFFIQMTGEGKRKGEKKETKAEFIYESNQIEKDFENKGMFIYIYTHITDPRREITPAKNDRHRSNH